MFEGATAVENSVTGLRAIEAPGSPFLFRPVARTGVPENLRERNFVVSELKIEIEPCRSPDFLGSIAGATAMQHGEVVKRESMQDIATGCL